MDQVQKDQGFDNMVSIHYHNGDAFVEPDGTARIGYYGVTGYPTTKVDGVISQRGTYREADYQYFTNYYWTRQGVESPLTLTVTGKYNPGTRAGWVKTTITNTGSNNIQNHALRYVIVESVYYPWRGLDSCWVACRKMLPDYNGIPFNLNVGQTLADSQSFTMDASWLVNQTRLVAFVQDDGTKEILQGGWKPLNSFSGVEGGAPAEGPGNGMTLAQNRPNPAKGSTEIAFSLPKAGEARLAVYDVQGRLVRTVVEGTRSAGAHRVTVSGLTSGVYFYRLEAGKASLTRSMLVTE